MLILLTSCNEEHRLESLYWCVLISKARINIDTIYATIEGHIGHYIRVRLVIEGASSPMMHLQSCLEFF